MFYMFCRHDRILGLLLRHSDTKSNCSERPQPTQSVDWPVACLVGSLVLAVRLSHSLVGR